VTPLILDVDTGIDDALAILYAAASLEAELVACTCLSGNADLVDTERNTRAVLELAGRADVEAAGRPVPFLRALEITPETHGPHGIGTPSCRRRPPRPRPLRARPDRREARRRPREVTLVTLGPLTNLAIALLGEPALPRLLRRWVCMGGAYRVAGNTTPVSEWNIHLRPGGGADRARRMAVAVDADPAVARALLLGLDVTERARSPPTTGRAGPRGGQPARRHARSGQPPPRAPVRGEQPGDPVPGRRAALYFEFHARYDGYGAVVHDPLVVAAALIALLTTEAVAVDVDASAARATADDRRLAEADRTHAERGRRGRGRRGRVRAAAGREGGRAGRVSGLARASRGARTVRSGRPARLAPPACRRGAISRVTARPDPDRRPEPSPACHPDAHDGAYLRDLATRMHPESARRGFWPPQEHHDERRTGVRTGGAAGGGRNGRRQRSRPELDGPPRGGAAGGTGGGSERPGWTAARGRGGGRNGRGSGVGPSTAAPRPGRRAERRRRSGRSADQSGGRSDDDGGVRRSSMRILLAIDGSVSSDRAAQLVCSLPLPPDSLVRIVAARPAHTDVLSMAWTSPGHNGDRLESDADADARHRREAIERYQRILERPGLKVEGFVVRGRAASAIVDEASAMSADLVVLGSRGHGTIATMLLGSTASEVVDHAPCPVLVARGNHLARSRSPTTARRRPAPPRTCHPLGIFEGRPISVVTVAETAMPVAAGFVPGLYDEVLASYSRSVDEAREDVRAESTTTAGRLAATGLDAFPVVLEGDAAAELVRFVTERGTGTIVMGTRGHTGIARLLLGSVARNVLLHAPCSVLIVRAPKGA
jgi:purine nucleosidase